MFKKPKQKDIEVVAKGFLAFEAGKRAGRAILAAIPTDKDVFKPVYARGLLGVAALAAAASYTGKRKELVTPALVGMAAEQLGRVADQEGTKMMKHVIATSPIHERMLAAFMGKNMGTNNTTTASLQLNSPYVSKNYPMLAAPVNIDDNWDGQTYLAEPIYNDYAGA